MAARMQSTAPAPRAATPCSAPTIAPTLSSSPCTASSLRYPRFEPRDQPVLLRDRRLQLLDQPRLADHQIHQLRV